MQKSPLFALVIFQGIRTSDTIQRSQHEHDDGDDFGILSSEGGSEETSKWKVPVRGIQDRVVQLKVAPLHSPHSDRQQPMIIKIFYAKIDPKKENDFV